MSGGGHPTTASHPAHSLTSPKPAPMVTIFIWLLLVMMMMMLVIITMIMMITMVCKGAVGPPASVNSSRKATKPHKPDGGQGSQYFTVQVGTIIILLLIIITILLLLLLIIILLIIIIIINGNKVSTAKRPPELSILHSAGLNCLCLCCCGQLFVLLSFFCASFFLQSFQW